MSRLLKLVGAAIVLNGCGKLPGFSVNAKTDSFQQVAARNDKVDILFIVDNSGSMDEEQQFLSDGFQDFISAFTDRELDFQIGVTTTDTRSNATNWNNTYGAAYNSNGTGSLMYRKTAGYQKILTTAMEVAAPNSVETQFRQNALFGTSGSGAEAGLLAGINFMSTTQMNGWNSGFIRDGAFLAIIVVSDEDESIGNNDATYIKNNTTNKNARVNSFLSAIDRVKDITDGDRSRVRFDAVVATDYNYCDTAVPGSVLSPSSVGTTYMEVADLLQGSKIPVCTNFGSELAEIGEALVVATTRFRLVQPPDGELLVYVNGGLVPQDASNGWTYLTATQEVEFHGTAIPSSGASISVEYVPATPI